jgi:hypothetical protein
MKEFFNSRSEDVVPLGTPALVTSTLLKLLGIVTPNWPATYISAWAGGLARVNRKREREREREREELLRHPSVHRENLPVRNEQNNVYIP